MNILRKLTPFGDASPPTPTSTASRSRNSAFDEDDQDNGAVTDYEESCLQHIFADEVFEHIIATKRSSGNPLFDSAMRYVDKCNRTLGDYNSQEDLFCHYGIRIQQENYLRSIANWILRILPCTSNTTKVDPLKTLAVQATIFLQENPDGGLGYSFGALLERYIAQRLARRYTFLEDTQFHLIGDEGPFCIPNHHCEKAIKTNRANGEDVDASVKLHLVRGAHVASSGPGSLLGRVGRGLDDFLEKTEGFVYLCHGTSVESASRIVREGPNPYVGASRADFGRSFYLTNSWEYALRLLHPDGMCCARVSST